VKAKRSSADSPHSFSAYAAKYEQRMLPGLAANTKRNNKRALDRVVADLGPLPMMETRRSQILKILRDIQFANGTRRPPWPSR
jgi:hypothetical protein